VWLDVGKGWLDVFRTQDCSARVQAYARDHWGPFAVTAFLSVQVGQSYFGFDYAACDQLVNDPNFDVTQIPKIDLAFNVRGRCHYWYDRDLNERPFLFFKNNDADDNTELVNVGNANNNYIIRNNDLGIEIELKLPNRYYIRVKGQAMKERTGYGLCGECGENVRMEHTATNAVDADVKCGTIETIDIVRMNWGIMDQLSATYQVPESQVYWNTFDKTRATKDQLQLF
jgi:hypothetical protein